MDYLGEPRRDLFIGGALSGRLVRSRWMARGWRTELAFFLVVVRMHGESPLPGKGGLSYHRDPAKLGLDKPGKSLTCDQ